jgi:hypothetical protein
VNRFCEKFPIIARYSQIILAAYLFVSLISLCPKAVANGLVICGQVIRDLRHLATTTSEQRKIETYGDQDTMGYGYLQRILKDIPDDTLFPFMRYRFYGMNAEVVFPGKRTRIDRRMLVGIDLDPSDVLERKITDARQITAQKHMKGSVTAWMFMTTWDYDLITGIRVHMKNLSGQPRQHFKATLLRSPSDPSPLADWSWTDVDLASPLVLHFDKPVTEVYSRGSMPFILITENQSPDGKTPVEIATVEVLGIKVQTAGYTILHQEGRCFTAFENSFLDKVIGSDSAAWRHYLSKLTNVAAVKARLQTPQPPPEATPNHD